MRDYRFLNNRAISGIARKDSSIYAARFPSPATASIAAMSSSERAIRRGRLGVLYTVGRPIFFIDCFILCLYIQPPTHPLIMDTCSVAGIGQVFGHDPVFRDCEDGDFRHVRPVRALVKEDIPLCDLVTGVDFSGAYYSFFHVRCSFLAAGLLNNGVPCTEAHWSADRAFASIYLIAYYALVTDTQHRCAGLVCPGAVPGANTDYCTGCDLFVYLCYCHFRFSFVTVFVLPYMYIVTYIYKYVKQFSYLFGQFPNIRENSYELGRLAHA